MIKNRRPISELNVFWNDKDNEHLCETSARKLNASGDVFFFLIGRRVRAATATRKIKWPKQQENRVQKIIVLFATYVPREFFGVDETERCHYKTKYDKQRHHTNHRESLHLQCVPLIQALQFGILETQFVPWLCFRCSHRVIHGCGCGCACAWARGTDTQSAVTYTLADEFQINWFLWQIKFENLARWGNRSSLQIPNFVYRFVCKERKEREKFSEICSKMLIHTLCRVQERPSPRSGWVRNMRAIYCKNKNDCLFHQNHLFAVRFIRFM